MLSRFRLVLHYKLRGGLSISLISSFPAILSHQKNVIILQVMLLMHFDHMFVTIEHALTAYGLLSSFSLACFCLFSPPNIMRACPAIILYFWPCWELNYIHIRHKSLLTSTAFLSECGVEKRSKTEWIKDKSCTKRLRWKHDPEIVRLASHKKIGTGKNLDLRGMRKKPH